MVDRQLFCSREELLELCAGTIALAPHEVPPLPAKPELRDVPEWRSFEHEAWQAGELARQTLSAHRSWKADPTIRSAILSVALHKPLARGRQSWILALGFVAAQDLASELVPLLGDTQVNGHVVDALLRMRCGDYAGQVWPLTQHEHAWIRKLARRYVKRYSAAA